MTGRLLDGGRVPRGLRLLAGVRRGVRSPSGVRVPGGKVRGDAGAGTMRESEPDVRREPYRASDEISYPGIWADRGVVGVDEPGTGGADEGGGYTNPTGVRIDPIRR